MWQEREGIDPYSSGWMKHDTNGYMTVVAEGEKA